MIYFHNPLFLEPIMETPTYSDPPEFTKTGDGSPQGANGDRRETIARGMDSAASSLHARADNLPGGEKVARAAHTTADAMEKAADYVRDEDMEAMLEDVQQMVKRHPGATLLAAVAAGFLLARIFSRH
jgi:hydroxypyruvate isomerase